MIRMSRQGYNQGEDPTGLLNEVSLEDKDIEGCDITEAPNSSATPSNGEQGGKDNKRM